MSSPLHLDVFVQWLTQTDYEKRMQWITSVEHIEALNPRIVVAGHKRPDADDDDPAAIRDFDQSLSESHSAQELVDKMMVLHGDLGNPYTLWTAAQSTRSNNSTPSDGHSRPVEMLTIRGGPVAMRYAHVSWRHRGAGPAVPRRAVPPGARARWRWQ